MGDPKSDLLWVLGLLGVLFVVWLGMGGPDRWEATGGPFIRPLPPLGSGEIYGLGDLGADRPGGFSAAGATPGGGFDPETGERRSPWFGQIKIESGNARWETWANREYLTLDAQYSNPGPINISGWRLVQGREPGQTWRQVAIPLGVKVFVGGGNNVPRDPIILAPAAQAVVVTGHMPNSDPYPIDASFRVNKCSGYLDRLENYSFQPGLGSRCPTPEEEPGVNRLTNECYDEAIRRLSSCQTPEFEVRSDDLAYFDGEIDRLDTECRNYIKAHFNYNACVSWHAADLDFFTDEWRVFLNYPGQLWEANRQVISLYDQAGWLVDRVSY